MLDPIVKKKSKTQSALIYIPYHCPTNIARCVLVAELKLVPVSVQTVVVPTSLKTDGVMLSLALR